MKIIIITLLLLIESFHVIGISDFKPITNNRTAIIISGHIRTGNITWNSGKIHYDKSSKLFSGDDPETPIQTMIEWLMKPLAIYGTIYNITNNNNTYLL